MSTLPVGPRLTPAAPASRPRRQGARLRIRWEPLAWLLRLGLLPLTLAQVAAYQQPGPHPAILVGLLCACSVAWVALLWVQPWHLQGRRGGPVAELLMVVIAFTSAAATLVDGPGWAANLTGAVVLGGAATARARTVVGVLISSGLGLTAGTLLHGGLAIGLLGQLPSGLYVAFYIGLFGCLALIGFASGLRRDQLAQAKLLLSQRQETLAEREHAAALAERSRIAREIHDILAHSLADLSIQLELADALLTDGGDRSGALDRVRHAHRLAADGLEETRRAIHALRSDSPPLPEALAAMVGAYHQAGSSVELDVEGEPRPLTAATGLAILRTAQEALANSHKHAAGLPIQVRLTYGRGCVSLAVSDRAQGAVGDDLQGTLVGSPMPALVAVGGGYGLAGMRERLRLAGGSLTAGPDRDGWSVHAEVPG